MPSVINNKGIILCFGICGTRVVTINLPVSYKNFYKVYLSAISTDYVGAANITPCNVYCNQNTLSSFQAFVDNSSSTGANYLTIGI